MAFISTVHRIMARSLQVYEIDDIIVTFAPAVCRHTGVCLRGLPLVFDVRRKRWVAPEAAPAAEVAAQVLRCPSGALQYRFKTSGGETSPGWVEPPETR